MTLFFMFFLILLTPISDNQKLNLIYKKGLIIWNVGQGQWVTRTDNGECSHFDAGGEFGPIKLVNQLCFKNKIYFSHWDWDHISFANKIKNSCIQQSPGGQSNSKRKIHLLSKIPHCSPEQKIDSQVRTSELRVEILNSNIQSPSSNYQTKTLPHYSNDLLLEPQFIQSKRNKKTPNSQSLVYLINSSTLIPGDSPSKSEDIWGKQILNPAKIRILILGHHGSRTSTSIQLLAKLNLLKMLLVSARKHKYGHPHVETISKAKLYKYPLIKTESWGNIFIEQ